MSRCPQSYDPKLIARSPYRMRVHSIPPIFSNKVSFSSVSGVTRASDGTLQTLARLTQALQAKINSWLSIEEETPTTCRQTLEGEIEIKILGLGHLAERIVVDNLKGVYKGVPKIAERYISLCDLTSTWYRNLFVVSVVSQGIFYLGRRVKPFSKLEDTIQKTLCPAGGHGSVRRS